MNCKCNKTVDGNGTYTEPCDCEERAQEIIDEFVDELEYLSICCEAYTIGGICEQCHQITIRIDEHGNEEGHDYTIEEVLELKEL